MERENTWQEIYQEICRFLVLMGMFLCLRNLFGANVSLGALGMAAAVLVAAAGVMGLGKAEKLVACLLFLACLCFVAARYQGYLVIGAKAAGNQLLEMINYHYRTEYLLWYLEAEEPGKSLFFLVLCGIVGLLQILLALSAWGQKRQLASHALVPALLILAILSLGKGPSTAGTILILSGLAAGRVEIARRGSMPLGIAIYMALGISILFANGSLAGRILEQCHGPWLKRQLHLEDFMLDTLEEYGNIQLFANAGAQTEYRLDNGEPDITGREAFQITLARRPKENIYLKGFVGGDYENGRWKSVSKQEFSDWSQQLGYSNEEYQQLVREYPYDTLKQSLSAYVGRENKVSLKLRRSTRGYTLVPYFSKIPAEQEQGADGSLEPLKQREFQWQSYLYLEDGMRVFHNNLFLGELGEDAVGNVVGSYSDYARQAYARLPQEGLGRLREFARQEEREITGIAYEFEDYMGITMVWSVDGLLSGWEEQKIRLVQELLWEDTEYSFDLERVPAGEDFAEYFLLGQKKGYCTHYATAGTLLLRMYGIPARYVMGYLVLPSDFKENADGTYTASVTDERGHAWAEVFQENVGFCPIEMTPPSYTEMLQNMGPGEDLKSALEGKEEKGEEGQPREDEPTKGQEQEKEETQKRQEESGGFRTENGIWDMLLNMGLRIAILLLAAASFAAIIVAALYFLRKHRVQRRKEAFSQPDRTEAVQAMSHRMAWILGILGYRRQDGAADQEYGALLQEKMPEMPWGQVMGILQKAAFSPQGIGEDEYQRICSIYGELEEKLRQEKGDIRKCFYDIWI